MAPGKMMLGRRRGLLVSIDWFSTTEIGLGNSCDLRPLFPSETEGWEHLRSMPVILLPAILEKVRGKGDKRFPKLRERPELVFATLQSPDFVSLIPEFRKQSSHWYITVASQDPQDLSRFVTIALSLANLEGAEDEVYRVVTIYIAERRNLYDVRTGQLRTERWKEAKISLP